MNGVLAAAIGIIALLLGGCAVKDARSILAPRDAPPAPVAREVAPPPAELGAEVRRASQVLTEAQRAINALAEIIAPTKQAPVATLAAVPAPRPIIATRELAPPPPATVALVWINPGGDAYHTRDDCPYVRPGAQPVPLHTAVETRRPCRTCGPGGRMYRGGVD